jgi:penicillin-binding protein 2
MLQLDRHVPSPGVPEFNRRFAWLIGVVATAFLVLVGRLWQLQILRGEAYYQKASDNFKAERFLPAVRGKIEDRRGRILVDNRPSFNVYVSPRYFTPEARERLIQLLALSPGDAEALRDKVRKSRAQEVLVLEDIGRDQLALVAQAQADLPGVAVHDVPHRNYLYGTLAAHVLGYMNQVSDAELEPRRADGYEEGDYVGRYGIERAWENYLRGKRGVERFVVDAKGRRKEDREVEALIDAPKFVPPVAGHDIVLTIDADLQRAAEKALAAHPSGGAAVIDVATGRILALVSKPAFDPNVMTGHLTRAEEAAMEADPHKPFLDKTLRQHYYPGSTFKFVTALAALDENAVSPDDKNYCGGGLEVGRRVFHCTKDHGSVNLTQALTQSCNVYFWRLAEKIGLDKIARVADDFGFGVPTGLGMNGDVAGFMPTKAFYDAHGGFRIGYALNTAIGQGDTVVTVLQLALAYAALSNGGNLWVPQIVDKVVTASGKTVAEYPPTLRRHVKVSPRALDIVGRGLWGVVNDKTGTAYSMRHAGLEVAGKTGTAQIRKLVRDDKGKAWDPERDHAWFAGYFPAGRPEIAVVVLVEHGGHGGQVAAPVAMEIIEGYRKLSGVKGEPVGSSTAAEAGEDGEGGP